MKQHERHGKESGGLRDQHSSLFDEDALEPVNGEMLDWEELTGEDRGLSRESTMFDVDRMINEGLGGGYVTEDDNGEIGETTTDTMNTVDETPRYGEEE